ncbi:methyltransferase domain-containing protein [Tumidithrix elongata RA019]|uniref:Methyltransferase domain-containing protein n=1 Tax=Tumidithrix elongata BACA0141 TaxID=2716417 RepID=A0AAW9PY70_9CYAN|nr:methyltransferase domain-containing protein [Tumidithrix elongata RA019]
MPTLNDRIRQFYDQSSLLWEQVWGEHMHHGYYQAGETSRNKDRRLAQIDLIEELLTWANLGEDFSNSARQDASRSRSVSEGNRESPIQVLDVGCGIGGSSLYLANKLNAKVTGITLSPVQAQRATQRAKEFGLSDRTQFQVADALAMPFGDRQFDLIWSLESGEHMADKTKFLQECYRVLKPNGRLIFATWCHRPADRDKPLSVDEKAHLQRIYDVYCLPYVISLPEYEAIAQSLNFQNIQTADWSKEVAPFWDVVIDSALTPASILGVLQSGLSTVNAALSLRLMSRGYARGLVKFGLLTASK